MEHLSFSPINLVQDKRKKSIAYKEAKRLKISPEAYHALKEVLFFNLMNKATSVHLNSKCYN